MTDLLETISFDNLAERVFEILKSRGYTLKMYQDNGEIAFDPSTEARKFFVEDEGMMVAINQEGENSELKVYISDESSLNDIKPVLNSLRQTASLFGILYNLRKYDKKLQPKEFAFMSYKVKKDEKENMSEAKDDTKLSGSSKSSYQKIGKPARIVIKHKKRIDDSKFAARSRDIDKIFIENPEGERLRFPNTWLQGARTMARHISEGGSWDDPIGNYIKEQSQSFRELQKFVKSNSKGLNEESSNTISLVKEYMHSINRNMKSMQGPKSYHKFIGTLDLNKPSEEILDEELASVRAMFNITEDNDKINNTLRSIAKIRKENIKEEPMPGNNEESMKSAKGVMTEFAEWIRESNVYNEVEKYTEADEDFDDYDDDDMFSDYKIGDKVKLRKEYADVDPDEVFTVTEWDPELAKGRIEDDEGVGWYIRYNQIEATPEPNYNDDPEMLRMRQLAGLEEVSHRPDTDPYRNDPSEEELDRAFEYAVDEAEYFINNQMAGYIEDPEALLREYDPEDIPDILNDLKGDAYGVMRDSDSSFELDDEDYDKAFNRALAKSKFGKVLRANSESDSDRLTNELITDPDLKQQMQQDPEAVINRFTK